MSSGKGRPGRIPAIIRSPLIVTILSFALGFGFALLENRGEGSVGAILAVTASLGVLLAILLNLARLWIRAFMERSRDVPFRERDPETRGR